MEDPSRLMLPSFQCASTQQETSKSRAHKKGSKPWVHCPVPAGNRPELAEQDLEEVLRNEKESVSGLSGGLL